MNQLADSVDNFLGYLAGARHVAPNTISAYNNDLRQFRAFLEPTLRDSRDGAASLAHLDAGSLGGFVFHLRDKGYSQATIARKIAAVKSFFRYAQEAGLVAANPAAALAAPRVRRAAPKAPTSDEIESLLSVGCAGGAPADQRDRAMLTLLYHSGMRVSEIVALDLSDLDLDAATVRCTERAGRTRSIPLLDAARAAIAEYLADGRPFFAQDDAESALFLNQRGMRLTRQGFWLIFKGRAKRAGVSLFLTPHRLRHAFALRHLGAGTSLRDLQELLGHVNISTTQVYTLASSRQGPRQ